MSGYNQILIDKLRQKYTCIALLWGLYRFKRMYLSLSNAPCVIQSLMNSLLGQLKYVIVNLDDVLIFSETVEQHIVHLNEVFSILNKASLKLNNSNCKFFLTKIDYLGLEVSSECES
eukprot:NODE_446_length_7296_cov_0.624427.p2 type:complete len:117 gc:universal NODE_446_length_7296_cov_0.624427:5985-6335(+)